MKRKEIIAHLDEIGMLSAGSSIEVVLVNTNNDKSVDVDVSQIQKGILVGVSYCHMLLKGEVEPSGDNQARNALIKLMSVALKMSHHPNED